MYIHNAWGKMQQRRCDHWAVYYTVSNKKARKKAKKKKTTFARGLLKKPVASALLPPLHRYHRCRHSARKQVLARAVSSKRKVNIQQASTTTIVYRGHLPEVVSVAWNRMGTMPVFFTSEETRERSLRLSVYKRTCMLPPNSLSPRYMCEETSRRAKKSAVLRSSL